LKVILFNGSPRKNGNTYHCLKIIEEEMKSNGIDCETIWIGKENIHGCIACAQCAKNKDKKCAITSDKINEYIEKIISADGIILGSPTYFANVSAPMKAFIDRVGLVSIVNGYLLKHKIGAAVLAVRRQGATHAFSSINFFFLINQMYVVGSSYWNHGIGYQPGEVKNDKEGINTFKNLSNNFVLLLKKMGSG
jgi:multimeric flavodoxin WrbA